MGEETPNTKSTEETTDRSIDTTVHSYEETSDENPDTKSDEDTADQNIDINTVAHEETTDEALDTTTITSEIGDHEFLCKETGDGNTNVDVPLKCVLTNGDEELTVRIVIPGDTLNGDKKKLF